MELSFECYKYYTHSKVFSHYRYISKTYNNIIYYLLLRNILYYYLVYNTLKINVYNIWIIRLDILSTYVINIISSFRIAHVYKFNVEENDSNGCALVYVEYYISKIVY